MADRTSAEIFGYLFTFLSEKVDNPYYANLCLEMAREFWGISKLYDFDPLQMECRAALEKFGLIKQMKDIDGSFYWGLKDTDF